MTMPTTNDSLEDWLAWLEHVHPTEIDMGLERVSLVADRLKLRPAPMPVILVGGTNGKGSTVAMLASIFNQAGYRVGAYTSPHINVFNERMCINETMLDDSAIVRALHHVETTRMPETLTYFEYTTLAAMVAFEEAKCDVVIMEVGLGGRLDATNLWDLAIGRPGKPLIVGEPNPPENLAKLANAAGMQIINIDEKLGTENALLNDLSLRGAHQRRNAACAIEAVAALNAQLPVNQEALMQGLANAQLAGRFEEVIIDGVRVVLDVAHNPAAAATVQEALAESYPGCEVHAVFSALNDKDIVGIVSALAPAVSN